MMKQILAGILLLASATFCHANRAVMEQLAASNNTIFVSTPNARVGISTNTPGATLDVAGNAQFGTSGKSTFSTTGALSLASGAALTLSGANGNIVTASSVNAGSFWGDASHLTGTVGISSGVTTTAALTGNGNAGSPIGVVSSSVAILSGGFVMNSQIDGSSITKQGNSFNGASQLVQLNSSSQYPAKDGSLITNISGTLSGGTNGNVARWTGSTSLSTSAFTDNGSTMTMPSGSALVGLAGSTINFNAGTVVNEWQWVADTVAVNDVGIGFAGLVSSVSYRVELDIRKSASSQVTIIFNADSGSNYNYATQGFSDANASLGAGGTGQSSISLAIDSNPPASSYRGIVEFASAYGGPSSTIVLYSRWAYKQTTNWTMGHSGGSYVGAANLSSLKINAASGTFSGVVKLFKRNGTAW